MLKSIQAKLVLVLFLLILLAMQVVSVYLLQSLERYYVRDLSAHLNPTARVVSGLVERHLSASEPNVAYLEEVVEYFSAQAGLDVSILDKAGSIITASGEWAQLRGQRYNQLDVTMALTGSRSEGIRIDPETGLRYYHLAVPIKTGDAVNGVVHLLGSLDKIYKTMQDVRNILLTAAAIAMSIVVVVGFALAKTITNPIRQLTAQAAEMATGNFDTQIDVRKAHDEIGKLGETFNYMGQRLKETLTEMAREKGRVEAILVTMTDGMIAVDSCRRIIMINPAGAEMLGVDPEETAGKCLDEIGLIEIADLEDTIGDADAKTLTMDNNRTLRVHTAKVLREEQTSGWVIVIHDITEQARLEQMRREFVANVSHELRTPLTTIKSYVETLLDGELENPDHAHRFLLIVGSETDRMVRMVRDLLHLSQLDQCQVPWRFDALELQQLLNNLVSKMKLQVAAKGLTMEIVVDESEPILINGDKDRLEQVFMNLISNAIEFTPQAGTITVKASTNDKVVSVSVIDSGTGIPQEDLPRVFERFYRVDKARSREFGGTGLGLAIAQEIVSAHNGTIQIASQEGHGTTVTVELPLLSEDKTDEKDN